MSGYALAMAATWAFAYTLRSDAHVRIDVLLPRMSPRIRAISDWVALAGVCFLSAITSWKLWDKVIDDYQKSVVVNDYPWIPVFIPKIVVAIGFSLLVVASVQMMTSMMAEKWLRRIHKAMGGDDFE